MLSTVFWLLELPSIELSSVPLSMEFSSVLLSSRLLSVLSLGELLSSLLSEGEI